MGRRGVHADESRKRAKRGTGSEDLLLFLNDSQSSELYPSCFGSSAKSLAVTLTEDEKNIYNKEKRRNMPPTL